MTKVVETPGGAVAGSGVTLFSARPQSIHRCLRSGETEPSVVVVKWLRSRAMKKDAEPVGKHCIGCRSTIPGANDDELRASGGVLLAGAGWLCGPRCERQYRLRFRIQPTPAEGSQAAGPARTPPPVAEAADEPDRRPAAEELAEALRNRRRRLNNGV